MRSKTTAAVAVAGLLLSLAACGGGGDDTSSSAAETQAKECPTPTETEQLTVGILPVIDLATFQIAQDQGYFEDEKLKVTGQMFKAGSEVTAAVLSGDVQFGWAAVTGSLNALSQNVPIVSVASGSYSNVDENDSGAMIVGPTSDIKSMKDLEGKTVSIIAQGSLADVEVRAALEKEGVDLSKVNFVEVGFTDIGAAISAGRIDAGLVQEPFVTILTGQGYKVVGKPVSILFDEPTSGTEWITSEQYASSNPCVVKRFQAAITKANGYAAEHPDDARAAVKVLIPAVPPAVVDKVILPTWKPQTEIMSYEAWLGLLKKYAGYSYKPDLEKYLRLTKQD